MSWEEKLSVDVSKKPFKKKLVEIVKEHGFVFLNGINVGKTSNEDKIHERLENFAKKFGSDVSGQTVGDSEREQGVFHTHTADFQEQVNLVIVYCSFRDCKGGESYLLDGKELYPALTNTPYGNIINILNEEQISGFRFYEKNKRVRFDFIESGMKKLDTIDFKLSKYVQKVVWKNTIAFKLKQGQAYLANDQRVAHGVEMVTHGTRIIHNYDISKLKGRYQDIKPGFKL